MDKDHTSDDQVGLASVNAADVLTAGKMTEGWYSCNNITTTLIQRSIFQNFRKVHCCPDFLFLELETSNFGCLLIF